jgi:hypothetical protein
MSIAFCQIGTVIITRPPQRTVMDSLRFRRLSRHLKDMLLCLVLSLFTAVIVYADEIQQGWVPEVIALPDDAEVIMDRAIGSSIRMLSFSTGADVDALFRTWSAALKETGYTIRPQQAEFDETAIEFSGHDILNAKIVKEATSVGDRAVITFDATLQ